jgi:iron(III) transport system ATP-binding protein
MVFQNYALWPHMSVLETVSFGLGLRGLGRRERRRRATSALEVVRMADLADRRPNQLSGGQQQRVALARALAIEPECLLLDEPLSNLDAKLRLEMRSEIRRVHDETRLTILYVTHDQKEALSLADRIALMRDGRIIQIGSPRELYDRPATRFAAGFVGEANFLSGRLRGVEGGRAVVETPLGLLAGRAPAAALAQGSACDLVVRPEALELLPIKVIRPANGLEAEIADVSFLGDLEQTVLRAAGPVELKAVAVPTAGATRRRGERVWVAFDPGAASVFAADDE